MTIEQLDDDERLHRALASLTVEPPREDFWATVRAGLDSTTEAGTGPTPHLVEPAAAEMTALTPVAPAPIQEAPGPVGGSLPALDDGSRSPDRLRFLALAAGFCLIAGLGTFLAIGGERPAVVATDIDQPTPEPVIDETDRGAGDDERIDGDDDRSQSDDQEVERGPIEFESGESSATVTGRIEGEQVDVWTFVAEAGQTGTVELRQENSTDLTGSFVIWGPDDRTVSSTFITDDEAGFVLPTSGSYQLRILRYRAGLRPEGSFDYAATLTIDPLVGAGGEALNQEAGTGLFTIGQGWDESYELEGCTIDGGVVTAGLSDRANPEHRIDLVDGELIISGGPDDVGTAEMLTVGPIVEIVGELETAGQFRLVIYGCEER